MNRDPIGELGGLNIYVFVGNNAINYVDSHGLFSIGGIIDRIWRGIRPSPWDPGIINPPALGGPWLPPGDWSFVAESGRLSDDRCDVLYDYKLCFFRRRSARFSDEIGRVQLGTMLIRASNNCPTSRSSNWGGGWPKNDNFPIPDEVQEIIDEHFGGRINVDIDW